MTEGIFRYLRGLEAVAWIAIGAAFGTLGIVVLLLTSATAREMTQQVIGEIQQQVGRLPEFIFPLPVGTTPTAVAIVVPTIEPELPVLLTITSRPTLVIPPLPTLDVLIEEEITEPDTEETLPVPLPLSPGPPSLSPAPRSVPIATALPLSPTALETPEQRPTPTLTSDLGPTAMVHARSLPWGGRAVAILMPPPVPPAAVSTPRPTPPVVVPVPSVPVPSATQRPVPPVRPTMTPVRPGRLPIIRTPVRPPTPTPREHEKDHDHDRDRGKDRKDDRRSN